MNDRCEGSCVSHTYFLLWVMDSNAFELQIGLQSVLHLQSRGTWQSEVQPASHVLRVVAALSVLLQLWLLLHSDLSCPLTCSLLHVPCLKFSSSDVLLLLAGPNDAC